MIPPCYRSLKFNVSVLFFLVNGLWLMSLLLMMQFEDPRDADDAIYGRDGYDFDGCRLRVS